MSTSPFSTKSQPSNFLDYINDGPGIAHDLAPGLAQNSTVAGHRTAHGGPFFHLDTTRVGDIYGVHYEFDTDNDGVVDTTALLEYEAVAFEEDPAAYKQISPAVMAIRPTQVEYLDNQEYKIPITTLFACTTVAEADELYRIIVQAKLVNVMIIYIDE